MTVFPIVPAEAASGAGLSGGPSLQPTGGFGAVLNGLETVNQAVLDAEAAAGQFAVSDTIAPHEVTFALEHARMSLELMLQVRSRLIEGYQEIMRMQL